MKPAVAAAALLLGGCLSQTQVSVAPVDLRHAYADDAASVLTGAPLSPTTRRVLSLVPEAQGVDVWTAVARLSASARVDALDRHLAASELLLAAAERDPRGGRSMNLASAYHASRLLFDRPADAPPPEFDRRHALATAIYGLAGGRYFLATHARGSGWTGVATERTPGGDYEVAYADTESALIAYFFDGFQFASELTVAGLANRYVRDGVGIPLVATRARRDEFPQERYFAAEGYDAPVTAVLRFHAGSAQEPVQARFELHDARRTEHVCIDGASVPLAADFTAPIAAGFARGRLRATARTGLFDSRIESETAATRLGFRLVEPYDPERTLLVLVHGLASSAESWRDLTNDVAGSPELRRRYQIVHYMYATSEPVLSNAGGFRRRLREFLDLVAAGTAPRPMVVVGHSMGGLLAKSLVVDSGDALWDTAFTVPSADLQAPAEVRERLVQTLYLRPWPEVGRVVFLGVPHRGSSRADGLGGRVLAALIETPASFTRLVTQLLGSPQIRPETRRWLEPGTANSVNSLSPQSPLLQAYARLAIVPGVSYHSVIGTGRNGSGDDGYVTVGSASLDGAASELRLAIDHDGFGAATVRNEVYRILLEHVPAAPPPAGCDP